jgi:hypothetical protein
MTIGSNTARVSFLANGVSTVFPVPIQAYLSSDFLVLATNTTGSAIGTLAAGASIVLVLNSDYTLASSGTLAPPQWTLTTQTSQLPSPYATGITLQVILNPAEVQQTQYVQGQAFPSLAVQTNFDRVTQMAIRLSDQMARAIIAPDGDVSPAMQLPSAALRANMQLIFTAAGNVGVGTLLPAALTQAVFNTFLAASGPYAITAAETTAGATIVNPQYLPLAVDRYANNTTPGTTDMTAAIKMAWNVAKAQGGGKITFIKGVQYALSSLDPASPINLAAQNSNGSVGTQAYQTQLYCQGGSNIIFDCAGAQLKSTITGGGIGFLFDNCQNISVLNPSVTGTQVQTTGVVTLGAITGGTLYVNGTYADVPLTGGTGNGAHATIVVAGGAVTSVTIIYPGGGYVVNDTLSASNANLGGAGSGFSVPVTSVTGAGNTVGTAAVLPFCVTSLSGVSSNITITDLTVNACYLGFAAIDGTNSNVSQGISLLGHTSVSNGEYGVALQGGGDDTFIANLTTYRVNRPYFFYGVQNVALASLDAQQTNYGFGAIIKAYNRSTRNIVVNEVFRNAVGNPTSRLSIQVQCDPSVITTPPTVKNIFITHDENSQPLQTGSSIEFDYYAGAGGTVLTATSANQLFDQIAIKGICLGYVFSTVQLTTAAAQCQINYDNLESNWSGIIGGGQDIRTGLGFIASREFFGTMSLQFGGTTVAGTGGAIQVFISDGFCKVQGTMTLTAKNGAGQATIVLPFKSRLDNNTNSVGPALAVSNFAALGGAMVGVLPGNSNLMNLYTQAATGEQSVLDTNFTATSSMYFDITYPI